MFLDVAYLVEDGLGSRLDEIQPSVVLLADSGGSRRRRDTNSTSNSIPDQPKDQQMSLTNGYKQSKDEFLKNVDIPDGDIKRTLQKNNLTNEDNVSYS